MSENTEPESSVKLLPIDEAIRDRRRFIERDQKELDFLLQYRDKLKDLPVAPSFCGGKLDFDNLKHADVLKVIRAFGGKWTKEPGDGSTIHYTAKNTNLGGMAVRCYKGEPPPSCKIIEVEEHVPEQIIPASVRKVRKLVCQPDVAAVIATAREKGLAEAQASSETSV